MWNFPNSPVNGQQFTPSGGPTYTWNGTGWMLAPISPVGIADAPADGSQYGRTNAAWTVVVPNPAPSTANPLMDGAAAPGTALPYAREDHKHPSDTSKLSDAPSNGLTFGRTDGNWTTIASGSGTIGDYTYTTATGTPSGSQVRFNTATLPPATMMNIADMPMGGNDISIPITLKLTPGAKFLIYDKANCFNYAIFQVTAATTDSGSFHAVPVVYQSGAGTIADLTRVVVDVLTATGGGLTVSDTAPPNATPGQLWWESDTGSLLVYFDDGDSKQWTMIVPGQIGSPGATGDLDMKGYSIVNDKDLTATGLIKGGTVTSTGAVNGVTGSFSGTLTANALVSASDVTGTGNFIGTTGNALLGPTGAGAVYLRPNGVGSASGQVSLDSGGNMTVNGLVTATNQMRAQAGLVCYGAGIQYISYSSNWIRWGWAGGNSLMVQIDTGTPGGGVVPYSIGGDTPLYMWALHGANGNIYANYGGGQVNWAIVWSDRRLKTNVVKAEKDALAMLNRLTVHELDYKPPMEDAVSQHLDYSLIADEVAVIYPEAYVAPYDTHDDDGTVHTGYASILYLPMIAALVKATQQLTAKVAELEARLGL